MSNAIALGSYEDCVALLLDQKLVRYGEVLDFALRFILRGNPSVSVIGNQRALR